MTEDRRDALLERDWADVWESLPTAPPLVPRPKTAQVTLRIPTRLLTRIKAVAAAKSLPYHAMARAWIVDALRGETLPSYSTAADEPQDEQLNIKLDNETLDDLKVRAAELRLPYHRLAREWIGNALTHEEGNLGLDPAPSRQPAIKDLIVLLLHAANNRGEDAIRGVTRLQKLLFVIEQTLGTSNRFYPLHYGPFDEGVYDAAEALRVAGFLRDSAPDAPQEPPSFAEIMASVERRAGPRDDDDRENREFALNQRGHAAAERLRKSGRAWDELFAHVRQLREEWDRGGLDDLVARVYQTWPKYAEKSRIKEKVAHQVQRRAVPRNQ